MKWRDIANAPKDGTPILAYWGESASYCIIAWCCCRGGWFEANGECNVIDSANPESGAGASHWMKLPKGPGQ